MNNDQEIIKLHSILYQEENWYSRKSVQNQQLEAIEKLGLYGSSHSIHALLPFLNHGSQEFRKASLQSIEKIFKKFNSKNDYETSLRHCIIKKNDIKKYILNFQGEELRCPLAIASMNGNGYIREEALNQIYKHRLSANLLPFVIFRLSDWVNEVRNAAEQNYAAVLEQENWQSIFNHIDLVFWLKKVNRLDLSRIYRQTIQFLIIDKQDETLEHFSELNEQDRFKLCQEILKIKPISQKTIDTLIKDKSYLVRLKLAEDVHRINHPEKTIENLIKDRSGIVRQKCLESRLKIPSELNKINFRELLNDRSGTIRNLARFHLKGSNVDFLKHYKKSLLILSLTESSIYGIGEVGSKSDVELLLPYIYSEINGLKRAAIRTILKLDPSKITTQLINELDSKNKAFRKLAVQHLSISPSDYVLDKCRSIFMKGNTEIKLSMLSVLCNNTSSKTLPDLLKAVNDDDEVIANAAWSHLINWRKKSVSNFVTPTYHDILRAKNVYVNTYFENELTSTKAKLWEEIPYFGRFHNLNNE